MSAYIVAGLSLISSACLAYIAVFSAEGLTMWVTALGSVTMLTHALLCVFRPTWVFKEL